MKIQFITLFFTLLFLIIPNVAANSNDFSLGLNYSSAGEYSKSIQLLETNCPSMQENRYNSAQCYFILCYNYYMLWQDSKTIVELENSSYFFGLKKDLLLNKSIENCIISINYSWSNLTNKDLSNNNESGFLISGLIFLTNDYSILGDYKNEEKVLSYLQIIKSTGIPNQKTNKTVESLYNRFYSTLPKRVEIELIGNINPLFFSQPEIQPQIILDSNDSIFNILHTEYINLGGFQTCEIKRLDGSFIFDKKLKLNKKNVLFYPFDSYYSEIFNISPSRIRTGNMEISLIGEDSNLKGLAYFDKDKIKLVLTRKIATIINVLVSFVILIIILIFFNRTIKYTKKESFQPKKLFNLFISFGTIASLIWFMTANLTNPFNFLTFIIFIFLTVIIIRFCKNYNSKYYNQEHVPHHNI